MRFDVDLDDGELGRLVSSCKRRAVATYTTAAPDGVFAKTYLPRPRLVVLGQGHIAVSLARFMVELEHEVLVLSGDTTTRQRALVVGATVDGLRTPTDWDAALPILGQRW